MNIRWLSRLLAAGLIASALNGETFSYWIQPCSPALAQRSKCLGGDPELAEWALQAWRTAAGSGLTFLKVADEKKARVRIYWASGESGLYGEAVPVTVDGQAGAAVYVLPDASQLGPDIARAAERDLLFRDSIVYLTCLHESGHALGLPHTNQYADIMYSFRYGGDIVEYFSRYRAKIGAREDIRKNPGMSQEDRDKLRAAYPRQK
jgi:hypothetical protein